MKSFSDDRPSPEDKNGTYKYIMHAINISKLSCNLNIEEDRSIELVTQESRDELIDDNSTAMRK